MPNTKIDTTKRKRDKNFIYFVFGAIGLALILLIAGRLTSEGLRENNDRPDSAEIGVDEIQINQNSDVLELFEGEVEATTGATIPDTNDTIVE